MSEIWSTLLFPKGSFSYEIRYPANTLLEARERALDELAEWERQTSYDANAQPEHYDNQLSPILYDRGLKRSAEMSDQEHIQDKKRHAAFPVPRAQSSPSPNEWSGWFRRTTTDPPQQLAPNAGADNAGQIEEPELLQYASAEFAQPAVAPQQPKIEAVEVDRPQTPQLIRDAFAGEYVEPTSYTELEPVHDTLDPTLTAEEIIRQVIQ